MACGKSSVGRALARRLSLPFVDTDLEIERATGRRPQRIFAADGEMKYRRFETRAIARSARGAAKIVALGGGAVAVPANIRLIRDAGTVVYLETPFETLFKRGERDRGGLRPLWRGKTRAQRRSFLKTLLASRRPLYRRASHIRIRSGRGTPVEIAGRIIQQL